MSNPATWYEDEHLNWAWNAPVFHSMGRASLRDRLERRYFSPLKRKRTRLAGVEFELPIVNISGSAVDFDVVHSVAEDFRSQFAFLYNRHIDDNGRIHRSGNRDTGDDLSFDCSYNTLELSFAPEADLNVVAERFRGYFEFLQRKFLANGHLLTGAGINPARKVNRLEPVPVERYRMLLAFLSSAKRRAPGRNLHDYPNFGLFSCASQVQLDVDEETLFPVLDIFSRLEPFKAMILANSPLEEKGLLCSRDFLWRKSLHGYNPANVDMYAHVPASRQEMLDFFESTSLYCAERDGTYLHFTPLTLDRYFSSPEIAAETSSGEKRTLIPQPSDLAFLRPFKFEDLTTRGTVEFRSVCTQPIAESFASAALHAGWMEKLEEVSAALADDRSIYASGATPSALRGTFVRKVWPQFDRKAATRTLLRLISIAEEGLRERGNNEEHMLKPLWRRAERLLSPGREWCDAITAGTPEKELIERYATL